MSFEERELFRERIRHLDKKIHPGLSKLTWISLGISEYFVADCRLNASRVQLIVDDYKGANIEIGAQCVKISELLLIKIDPKRVYADMDFDTYQVSFSTKANVFTQLLYFTQPLFNRDKLYTIHFKLTAQLTPIIH